MWHRQFDIKVLENMLSQYAKRSYDFLWREDIAATSPLRRRYVLTLRLLYAFGRNLAEGQLTLRAMSLVYTTPPSLVPLLALPFSVLKGFGVQNQVRPLLLGLLARKDEAVEASLKRLQPARAGDYRR